MGVRYADWHVRGYNNHEMVDYIAFLPPSVMGMVVDAVVDAVDVETHVWRFAEKLDQLDPRTNCSNLQWEYL